jgi:hypothetical protein
LLVQHDSSSYASAVAPGTPVRLPAPTSRWEVTPVFDAKWYAIPCALLALALRHPSGHAA